MLSKQQKFNVNKMIRVGLAVMKTYLACLNCTEVLCNEVLQLSGT